MAGCLQQIHAAKNPLAGNERVLKITRCLCADYVRRLEAFGALEQVKLHSLTLV